MFCTSLRRRASFASVTQSLNAPPLALKESQLGTHDLEIPFSSAIDPRIGKPLAARCCRVLLISPDGVRDARFNETLQRIEHFAALTGGQDLAIVFLLNQALTANSVTAKDSVAPSMSSNASDEGVYALTKLQVELMKCSWIPHLPVLLLAEHSGIQMLLQNHLTTLTRVIPNPKPLATPLDLLQHCTAKQPMSQHTAYLLSDLFPGFRELATACLAMNEATDSLSPSALAGTQSSEGNAGTDSYVLPDTGLANFKPAERLQMLRDLIGDQECQDIVDFWKEEWIID